MNIKAASVVPFSLKDAPSLIERIFPSMKISVEAQKERKAVQGQAITTLGTYWKGRKPLILVRACILASLIPATEAPHDDLAVFEALMMIDDESFLQREMSLRPSEVAKLAMSAGHLHQDALSSFFAVPGSPDASVPDLFAAIANGTLRWKAEHSLRAPTRRAAHSRLSYEEKVAKSLRVDELASAEIDWNYVNKHLGTQAGSIDEVVEQLGIMRFGRRPKLTDTFAGGGSIPFEAARIGCDTIAADLNPVACMLNWGALNVIGAGDDARRQIEAERAEVAAEVDRLIIESGVETDSRGNRAKAFLYCIEVTCPQTGWTVPLLPNRIISKSKSIIVDLLPDHANRRYDFALRYGVESAELEAAEIGTLTKGRVVHPMNPDQQGVSIKHIRGDGKGADGTNKNGLRSWGKHDFCSLPDDVYRERLYAIQWVTAESISSPRPQTFFAAPTDEDLLREDRVREIVSSNIVDWQASGLIPNMAIEAGDETDRLHRERGWTHWHHLFSARQLHYLSIIKSAIGRNPVGHIYFAKLLDWSNKLCYYGTGAARESISHLFYNQAFNTLFNYGVRSCYSCLSYITEEYSSIGIVGPSKVVNLAADQIGEDADLIITDPPYADAVNYHEITEFFIAWLRTTPPEQYANWNWDSRRRLAIKGKGEEFRASMVQAYGAMANHMPQNGIQIVMFTHQDGKVWSDMAQIFWGAGLQVMADWYIATETTSELKKGGYVQGTHIIVLRKRAGDDSGYSDEITQEVKEEVARQIEEMVGLNQALRGHGRSENLFNDADLQMAGYAAALRVLTKYVKIDGKDMTVEALRPRAKNERTVIDDIIEYAVQVANEHLVPEGMAEQTWRKLTGTERFYLKMMDIETTGSKKVDNYQNFAKAFRVADYGALMSSVAANSAALKSAADFGKRQMGEDEFGSSMTRTILYALWEMKHGVGDEEVLGHLRDLTVDYLNQRGDLQAIADYIAAKRKQIDVTDSQNATILAGLIKNERLG